MKIKHRVRLKPPAPGGDLVDDSYEREVQRSTAALEAAYRKAQKRLEKSLDDAKRVDPERKSKKKRALELWALVELRRAELEELALQMQSSPQSAGHRGTSGWRPVPINMGKRI